DLDGDGAPEILFGGKVFNSDGTLRWVGAGGNVGGGPFATVVDLDLDGAPEVVVGDAAYSRSGAFLWDAGLPDGYTAAGNFDADPFPEIVLAASARVWLLD